jgi:plastocyanin
MNKYILLITALVYFLAGFSQAHQEIAGPTIHLTEKGFEPGFMEIELGQKVIFENAGRETHWPASDFHPTHTAYPNSNIAFCGRDAVKNIFDACREIRPGESWEFVFQEPGRWTFHDHLNPGLSGTIVVKEKVNIYSAIKKFLSALHDLFWVAKKGYVYDAIQKDSEKIVDDDAALFSYLKRFGTAETLARLEEIDQSRRARGTCHARAHLVGNFTYELFGNKAFELCSLKCGGGCYHGTIGSYAKEVGIKSFREGLKKFCLDSELHDQCFHGLGHGIMAWANYELFDALEMCDGLTLSPKYQKECWQGVFMENVTASMAEEGGHRSKYISADVSYPCTIVADKYELTCHQFTSVRIGQLYRNNPARMALECSKVPKVYHRACFSGMGAEIILNKNDIEYAIQACSNAPTLENNDLCLQAATKQYLIGRSDAEVKKTCEILKEKTSLSKPFYNFLCSPVN